MATGDRMAIETAKNAPLVSICIPTYNRADMVGTAINSALGQTYTNIEVIVVDNASTDNTEAIVAAFSDNRLKYIRNRENLGLFGNFNRCIEVAGGEYIHILHSDDYIYPDFTEKCVSFFQSHPDVAMTFTSTRVLKENNLPAECILFHENTVFHAPEGFRRILAQRPLVSCPSVMVRRSVYQNNGNFSLEYPYSADYYMWLQIARVHDIAYINDAWLVYRQGEHSESFRLLFSSPAGYLDLIKILIRVKAELAGEEGIFTPDLNTAARRHMNDCLFASITRSRTMRNVSPTLFIGFAFMAWTLVRPVIVRDWLKKTGDLLRIIGIWTVVLLPGGHTVLEKIFHLDPKKY